MLDHVLVFVNGRRHEVRGREVFLSLSDFLRRTHGLNGTKIVCSEGDCGACTVLIGRPAADGNRLVYRPVDSCIQFMFQLEGTHIVTIEGLGGEADPSAVQQAMIDSHGSQCGFCTPGFVVAMTGLLEERDRLDESSMRCGLTGNLCRCTGYTPIFEAGGHVDISRHERLGARYSAEPILAGLAERNGQAIEIARTDGTFPGADGDSRRDASRGNTCFLPASLDEAVRYLDANPDAVIVAGATDVGVRINKTAAVPAKILDLNRVAELDGIAIEPGELVIGARTSWTALEQVCAELAPEFYEIITVFGAPQIRHVGTIGGNLANASPIADSLPFLFIMDAVLELRGVNGTRSVPITEFYQGYKQFDLRPGELIARIRLPLPAADELVRLYKVSRRRDLDIASFTAGIRLRLSGEAIAEAAVAFGAVGPTVIRARKTEAFLRGRPLDEDTMQQAGDVAVAEIAPISDVRGAADYRYQLTRNILLKFYHETQATAVPA